ncbi:MAG: flagellar FlbD family protein [Acidobacteria bacterium]|nr:flagellar FlbD family protein [Acidobacteriota bacterium]
MIHLTRINHSEIVLNSDLIELIETTPDTVISLANGQKVMVLEQPDQIIDKIVSYRRRIATPWPEGVNDNPGTSAGTRLIARDVAATPGGE